MPTKTYFDFTSRLTEREKEYVIDTLKTRVDGYFKSDSETETIAQIASKFQIEEKSIAVFATCFRDDAGDISIIGVETPDLKAAKDLQNEFHNSLKGLSDESFGGVKPVEFSSTWVNPELN